MNNSINAALFDRFMLVNRKMRQKKAQAMAPERENAAVVHREIILVILYKRGCGMKQQDVADEIYVTKSTLSEMINRLVGDGLLERAADPQDRRNTIIALTERGKARAEEVMEKHAQAVDFMFRNLTGEEKNELIRLLNKLLVEDGEELRA